MSQLMGFMSGARSSHEFFELDSIVDRLSTSLSGLWIKSSQAHKLTNDLACLPHLPYVKWQRRLRIYLRPLKNEPQLSNP